jgi:protein-L-isoaspartate(D-aspartate) O-methyltransferase
MTDFASQRKTMVDNQIRTVDVTDHAVIAAFGTVGREAFVPAAMRELAYIDRPVQVAPGRFVQQPAPLARLIQLAAPQAGEKVLIVGGNSGYSAAIVAELGASVVMLEENPDLVAAAREALAGRDVTVVSGPLAAGWAAQGPYDLIVFDGSIEVLPQSFIAEIGDGGRIVAVEGTGQTGRATVTVKSGASVSSRFAFNLPATPLPGFAAAREFAL